MESWQGGSGEVEHPLREYTLQARLGKGAYGEVFEATHDPTGIRVAVEIIRNLRTEDFEVNVPRCRCALAEVRLLRHFKHENIITLFKTGTSDEVSNFSSLWLILEGMETDLSKVIYGNPRYTLLDEHQKFLTYQLLRGLKVTHSAGIIHCDLKPANLLINIKSTTLKICDFGLACEDSCIAKTGYVATQWYRPPEVIGRPGIYRRSLDLWSAGCILGEMLTNSPLFPGKDHLDQILLVFQKLGRPDPEDFKMSQRGKREIHKAIKGRGPFCAQPWSSILRKPPIHTWNGGTYLSDGALELYSAAPSETAIDLVGRLLVWNPDKRLTVQEALDHEYLGAYAHPDRDPIAAPLPAYSGHGLNMGCE